MTSAGQDRVPARRPAAGIPIDAGYLEHLRNMRKLSRAQVAELVGAALFDRDWFNKVLDGTEPLDARTLRVMTRVLGETPPGRAEANGSVTLLDCAALDALLASRGWSRDDLAGKVARACRSRDSVAKIENGERNPTPGTLGALCTVLSTPDHVVEPGELITGGSPRSRAREAAAKKAREDYYEGLRWFASTPAGRDIPLADEHGEIFPPELRQAYDKFLLDGGGARSRPGPPRSTAFRNPVRVADLGRVTSCACLEVSCTAGIDFCAPSCRLQATPPQHRSGEHHDPGPHHGDP